MADLYAKLADECDEKDRRIAELEARVLDLECAIRYATYLDRDRMTVHPSHHDYVDLSEKAPILREVHAKHPMKA